MFDVAEGYDVFWAKRITKINTLASSAEVLKRKKRLILCEDNAIYLKRSSNENQDKYTRLSAANFVESMHRRRRLLKGTGK
ncbi:hypothetical protein GN958_ATG14352 [Phytophthora infestans]|nr:hypothetical protein GN958_ATG14484 [Phytophthora infestans]KAF4136457.1 hypothetical protein GN958_ATG14352 [Phytophthora infestans]